MGDLLLEARRQKWLAETHDRTERCRPCGINPEHCDIHGKRFTPRKEMP